MRLVLSHSFVSGVLLAVSCGLLWGQGKPKRGTLNIEVVDPAGNAIPHADVRFSPPPEDAPSKDRKSTRLNSSHVASSYAVFCLKKKISRDECEAWPADGQD